MTQPAQQVALVLTTFGVGQAMVVARALVEERLAACVNVLPAMTSVYQWKGAVHQEAEEQVVITARILEGLAAQIDQASLLLQKP